MGSNKSAKDYRVVGCKITPEAYAYIKAAARQLKISESEYLRRLILVDAAAALIGSHRGPKNAVSALFKR